MTVFAAAILDLIRSLKAEDKQWRFEPLIRAADIDEADELLPADGKRDDFLKRQLMEQMAQFGAIDPEAAAGTIEHVFGSGNEDEVAPIPGDPQEHNYGWIMRNGMFFGCMYHHHAAIARRIWKFIEKTTDEDKLADPERAGDDAGWVRVTKSAIDGRYKAEYDDACGMKPTRQQRATLEEWAMWHHQDIDDPNMRI